MGNPLCVSCKTRANTNPTCKCDRAWLRHWTDIPPLSECHLSPACSATRHTLWVQFLDSGTRRTFLPVGNGGSLTSLPLGGVLSYRDLRSLDAPVVRPGLAKGSLSWALGENCQPRVTLRESWGIKLQHQRRSQGQSWTVCLERGWEGVRVTAEGLKPH